MRLNWILLCCLAAIAACSPAPARDTAAGPGFSPTPPAAGPQIKTDRGYMVPYVTTIPGTEVKFEMVPIPGGKFKMGSPATEEGRAESEGPQFEVEVEPLWMGKHEVTWAEYRLFMSLADQFAQLNEARPVTEANQVDAVTAPSNLYSPDVTFTHGGGARQPAVTMSQQAAKQYTKWLSKLTGVIYRLPTEAEWEHACRAGTTTAYSFGDDDTKLGEYAWFVDSSDDTTHPVGQKKPNPWGLYDMYGNTSEWVIDQFIPDGYQKFAGKSVTAAQAIAWPTKLFPRVLRGGSFENDAAQCRSATRIESSDVKWKEQDPNLPKSPWWFTQPESLGVGFRIVHPLRTPTPEELTRFWEADVDVIREAERQRVEQGRGARGVVDPTLPEAVKKLDRAPKK